MATETHLLYLEPDDEITSVVRRLREADASRVVLVASGRTKATTSAVALRLLAQVAAEEGREVVLVADAFGRSLAGEAGIPAFASVTDANADGAVAPEPAPPRRAPIHVVRGEPAPVAPLPARAPAPQLAAPPARPGDETQAVRLPPPLSAAPARRLAPGWTFTRLPRAALAAVAVVPLLAAAAAAALLPGATISIRPATLAVGPRTYDVQPAQQPPDEGVVSVTLPGTATGVSHELVPATGSVTFLNWNTVAVEVPAGTQVSAAGDPHFATAQRIVVPSGRFLPDGRVQAGEASVGITALEAGPGGNVAAGAIDTVEDPRVRAFLRGFPNNRERLVVNPAATSGGADNEKPVVEQADVDAVIAEIIAQLLQGLDERLAAHGDRLYPSVEPPEPVIEVPEGLVGREGEATFELSGTLTYAYPYVLVADAEASGRDQLLADAEALPSGTTLLPESVEVDPGQATLDGQVVHVEVRASAAAAPDIDEEQVRELAAGRTPDEVRAALESLGEVTVALWPDWVDRVPSLGWRIEIELVAAEER